MLDVHQVAQRFEGAKPYGDGYMVRCPGHQDDKQSLHISPAKDGGVVLNDFAYCSVETVMAGANPPLEWADIRPSKNGHHANGRGDIVAASDYRDESSKLICQAVRFEPKGFSQRRPTSDGHWIWRLTAGPCAQTPQGDWIIPKDKTPASWPRRDFAEVEQYVPYRLPELLADESDGWVFVPEGERDVDETLRAWGLTATTNIGGAGKWRKEYAKYFRGRKVCILPDNDPPPADPKKEGFAGQRHAVDIYNSLRDVAECVRILALPGLPLKGDVTDWKRAGGTKDELLRMADEVAKIPDVDFAARVARYTQQTTDKNFREDPAAALRGEQAAEGAQEPPPVRDCGDKVKINIGPNDMPLMNAACWEAIRRHNDPPVLFSFGHQFVRIARQKDGGIRTEMCTPEILTNELSKWTVWYRDIESVTRLPLVRAIKDVLATRDLHLKLPPLCRIVNVPVFAPDGTLQTTPGYDPKTGNYYAPLHGFEALPVPDIITKERLDDAKKLILEPFYDFPFAGEADRHNVIGLLLLPFARDMIDGPTPIHVFDSSMPSSGKTKLATVALIPGLGPDIASELMSQPRDEDEWRKGLTTKLIEGKPVVFIDNVSRLVDSGAFAAATTGRIWSERILGGNTSTSIKINTIWVVTGNNIAISSENSTRSVPCRLQPLISSPEERTGFLHPELEKWTIKNRARLVQAAHVVVKSWLQSGQPNGASRAINRYSEWARVIGGILYHAGFDQFLTNYREFLRGSDTARNALSLFSVTAYEWMDKNKLDKVSATDLLPIADGVDGLNPRGATDRARITWLGKYLGANREVVVSYLDEGQSDREPRLFKIVTAGHRAGCQMWKVEWINKP
jgi:hypothetical protein